MIVFSDQDDEYRDFPNDLVIMTNFHLFKDFDLEDNETWEPYGQGYERYNFLKETLDEVAPESEQDVLDLLSYIYFSQSYTHGTTWRSDFADDFTAYGGPNITNQTPIEEVKDYIEWICEQGREKTRESEKFWQTVHSLIYNFNTEKTYFTTQEGDTLHEIQ